MNEATKISLFDLAGSNGCLSNNKTCELNVKMGMSNWLPVLLFLFIPNLIISQVGVNARYLFGKSSVLEEQEFSQNGVHVSVEYHLRLKEKRLEFRPGLGYRFTHAGPDDFGYIRSVDFDLGTALYPFDFSGDCDCPTFSKQGGFIKKGFFIELIPGVAYQLIKRIRNQSNDPDGLPVESKNFIFKLGGAAGIDIGLSDHFTLTPMFSATLLSTSGWAALQQNGSTGDLNDMAYLGTGIRITYSSDDKKRRRRN